MTVLICPVRPGETNDELRYAMRSWEANLHLPGGLELWTVGFCPPWLKPDRHVSGNFYPSLPLAVLDNVRLGAEEAVNARETEVVYMNDDFFCLDPVGSILPIRRNISLRQHADQFKGASGLWWPRSLLLTLDYLRERGHEDPHSYEVHRPLVANPEKMLGALLPIYGKEGGLSGDVPQWRTLYGVLNEIEAHPVRDAKLSPRLNGFGSPWVSTSDESWRRYRLEITPRFQKPSRWEIG